MLAIVTSKKQIRRLSGFQGCAAKRATVDRGSINVGPLSAALVSNDENVFISIDLDEAQDSAASTETTLLEGAL